MHPLNIPAYFSHCCDFRGDYIGQEKGTFSPVNPCEDPFTSFTVCYIVQLQLHDKDFSYHLMTRNQPEEDRMMREPYAHHEEDESSLEEVVIPGIPVSGIWNIMSGPVCPQG